VAPINNPIKFGTDGWRGIIAADFTFDNVRACAQGVAAYLKQVGLAGHGLVVGYDTRFASEDFAAATAEVIAANGIKVYLASQAVPTPVASFGVLDKQAGGAVVITASHNAAEWNGFKFKTARGNSAPPDVTVAIENKIALAQGGGEIPRLPLVAAVDKGLVVYVDFTVPYFEQLKRLVDLAGLRQSALRVVVDPMYGTGAGYFKELLAGGTVELVEINAERNPLFPGIERPEPIAVNLSRLADTVKRQGASVGMATDGDADRIGIIDENGNFLTQLQVFALLCLYLLEVRGERGAIIKTITTSSMINRLGEMFNVPVYETAVGFKYVAPLMMSEGALIGGEESGGYGFRGHVPERDGVLAGLCFLDLMVKTGRTPAELLDYLYSKVGPHYYKRVDVAFLESERAAINDRLSRQSPGVIGGVKVAQIDSCDGFRFTLADNSWLLVRFSGTEPLLRIYAETDDTVRLEQLLAFGREMAGV